MSVREFLKPTIGKISLFIVLFLIIIHIVPCSFAGGVPPGPYVSGWTKCGFNIVLFGLGGQMTDGGYSFLGRADLAQYGTLIFVLLLIVSYLLSCTIVWGSRRFFKKI